MVKLGKYKHFKGGIYEVTGTSRLCSEGHDATLVHYKSLENGTQWSRIESDFCSLVDCSSGIVPRFTLIAEMGVDSGLPEGKLVTIELTPRAAQEVDRLCSVYGLTIAELFRQALALVRDANFAPKKALNEDTGNEEGSGIPSSTMPVGVQCTSCGKLTSNDAACNQCGAVQKEKEVCSPRETFCASCGKQIPNGECDVACSRCGALSLGSRGKRDGYQASVSNEASIKDNDTLRTRISMLELALDEIYCSVHRARPDPEYPTDWKAVLRVEYSKNIELLVEARRLKDLSEMLKNEIYNQNVELVRLRNIIAENNIKPGVTGQGVPPRPPPKKS